MKQFLKGLLSEVTTEKLARFKNLQKESFDSLVTSRALPAHLVNIGRDAFHGVYLKQIPINTWKHINKRFGQLTDEDAREQFVGTVVAQIANCPEFISVIDHVYLKHLITEEELYLALLGSTLYMNGRIQEAHVAFRQLVDKHPRDTYYLYLYRSAIQLDDNEATAFINIQEAINSRPGNPYFRLCLASSCFRTFQTKKANEELSRIGERGLERIRKFPIAGMPYEKLKDSDAELKRAIEHRLLERPKSSSTTEAGDPYNDDFNDVYWPQLFHQFVTGTRFQNAWSFLSSAIGECIDHALKSDRSIRKVIDFGAYCAYPLFQLSQEYPDVDFAGVDRDKSTKRFNELAFGHVANLTFHAKHVQELLPLNRAEDNTLLFHSRTGTLIYPEKLKEIYRDCAKFGISLHRTLREFCSVTDGDEVL